MPSFIILAGKTHARHRAVVTHCSVVRLPVHMNAVAISTMCDKIRSPEFPADDALFNILFRQSEWKFAAHSSASLQPVLAVHVSFMFERIFVFLRI